MNTTTLGVLKKDTNEAANVIEITSASFLS